MQTKEKSMKKANFIMMLFPIVVMLIFGAICYFTKIWLFAAFNAICIGLFFLYAAVLQGTVSKKACAIICAVLLALNGLLINLILPVQTQAVKANIEDCVEYEIGENKKEYKLLLSYEIDGNKYYNFDKKVKHAYETDQNYDIIVDRKNPENLFVLGVLTGRLVGVGYLIAGVAIVVIYIYISIKNRDKKPADKSNAVEGEWEESEE